MSASEGYVRSVQGSMNPGYIINVKLCRNEDEYLILNFACNACFHVHVLMIGPVAFSLKRNFVEA